MTSFHRYQNGLDPTDAGRTYNLMTGRHRDGSPMHVCDDPLQPVPTFEVPGDPTYPPPPFLCSIDTVGDDRRLCPSRGPFTMEPGGTQVVIGAMEGGQGTNQFTSVSALRNIASVASTMCESTTAVESYLVESRAAR